MNGMVPHWRQDNIGSGTGLVSLGTIQYVNVYWPKCMRLLCRRWASLRWTSCWCAIPNIFVSGDRCNTHQKTDSNASCCDMPIAQVLCVDNNTMIKAAFIGIMITMIIMIIVMITIMVILIMMMMVMLLMRRRRKRRRWRIMRKTNFMNFMKTI